MANSQLGILKKNDNRVKHVNCLFRRLPKLSFLTDFEEEKLSVKNLITFPVKSEPSIVMTVPLRQGDSRKIEESEIDEWQKNYPEVNVRQEIRKLIAWNQANPDRQKTERGINRHIQGWLAHTQQQQTQAARSSPRALSTWEHNMAVMKAVLEEDCGN